MRPAVRVLACSFFPFSPRSRKAQIPLCMGKHGFRGSGGFIPGQYFIPCSSALQCQSPPFSSLRGIEAKASSCQKSSPRFQPEPTCRLLTNLLPFVRMDAVQFPARETSGAYPTPRPRQGISKRPNCCSGSRSHPAGFGGFFIFPATKQQRKPPAPTRSGMPAPCPNQLGVPGKAAKTCPLRIRLT